MPMLAHQRAPTLPIQRRSPHASVVYTQGLWGSLIMLLVIFPLAARTSGHDINGCYESLEDSIAMFKAPVNEQCDARCAARHGWVV